MFIGIFSKYSKQPEFSVNGLRDMLDSYNRLDLCEEGSYQLGLQILRER